MKIKSIALMALAGMLLIGCKKTPTSENALSVDSSSVSIVSDNSEIHDSISNSTEQESSSSNSVYIPPVVDTYNGTYYNSISTSATGSELLDSLHTLVCTNFKSIGYGGLWSAYNSTDKIPGQNYWYDIYRFMYILLNYCLI